jgi:hypothetical protein
MENSTLEDHLNELGIKTREGVALGSVRFDLAILASISRKNKKESPIEREDFIAELGSNSESNIRTKINEFYSQFGFPVEITNFGKIFINMGECGTAAVTITRVEETLFISTNIW